MNITSKYDLSKGSLNGHIFSKDSWKQVFPVTVPVTYNGETVGTATVVVDGFEMGISAEVRDDALLKEIQDELAVTPYARVGSMEIDKNCGTKIVGDAVILKCCLINKWNTPLYRIPPKV